MDSEEHSRVERAQRVSENGLKRLPVRPSGTAEDGWRGTT